MAKKISLSLICTILCLNGYAQIQQFTAGVRGGAMFSLTKDFASHPEPAAYADFGYTVYGEVTPDFGIGLHTGLSIGYSGYSWGYEGDTHFTNTDYMGLQMDYTIKTSSAKQQIQQIQAEIPIQMALRANGFILNAGIKLSTPKVWNRYEQSFRDMSISAYYPAIGVTVTNELITGLPTEEQLHLRGGNILPGLSVAAAFNIGYEWSFGRHSLGVCAFVDYSFAETEPEDKGETTTRLVEVSPISNPMNPVPTVTTHPISAMMSTIPHTLCVGLSAYYALDFQSNRNPYQLRRRSTKRYYPIPRRYIRYNRNLRRR